MPLRRGDCLMIVTGPVEHLTVVLNDPVFSAEHGFDAILVVNFSTVREGVPHDPACVVTAGVHAFIRHPSYVPFSRAVVLNAARLAEQIDSGVCRRQEPASPALLAAIRSGVRASDEIPQKILRFIRHHVPELINP